MREKRFVFRNIVLPLIVVLLFGFNGFVFGAKAKTTGNPTAFYVDKPRLVYGREGWDMKFPIDPGREHIYGVSYEARGTPGSVVSPGHYWTLRADGSKRQEKTWINYYYGSFRIDVDDTWQTGRIEIFTKKGAAWLVLTMGVKGVGKVFIRNVCLKEGGFPENPPVRGAPYLKWINSLKSNRSYAELNPLLNVDDKNDAGIFCFWTRNIHLPSDLPGRSYFSDIEVLKQQVQPFLEVPIDKLIEFMPGRRPWTFGERSAGYFDYRVKEYANRKYRWDPREPDILRKQDGSIFNVAEEYPVTGYEEVKAPSGKVSRYAYHEASDKKGQSVSSRKRVYLDQFMSTVRINELCRTAHAMAGLYRKTGNKDYVLRSAAILWAWARTVADWPIYGQIGSGEQSQSARFWPPDTYEHWFAFITCSWYTPAMRTFIWPARNYDLIREAPVWDEVSKMTGRDCQQDIEDGLLHAVKMGLKYDAYYRTNEWKFYHNTIGQEIKAFIEIGRAIGCPELLHYAFNKTDGTFHNYFMASGMSPECPGYLHDTAGGLGTAFTSAQGYSDPPGYVAKIDGKHIDSYDLRKLIPLYNRACMYMNRLRFPDGSLLTVHDSWANTIYDRASHPRVEVFPFFLPEFGHAILGWGKKPDRIEAHLHCSGNYNHRHEDMLNFILWAYGDELTADIGYTHLGGYAEATISHNLVLVDNSNQQKPYIHKGDLIAWYPQIDAVQVAQASGPHVYKKVDRYRRTIIAVPFKPGRDAVVDIFEVHGGNRHEWMTNGCADYAQNIETDLVTIKELDNLAEDGKAFILGKNQNHPYDKAGKKSHYYGAFHNVRICENPTPWQITMTAGDSVPEDTPGAGPRAKSKEPKPGLRLNWLSPLEGQVFICQAPRNRYYRELQHMNEARAAWNKDLMPKVIVRRDGDNLSSTFVAVWEPFQKQPWLEKIDLLKEIPEKDGVGVMLQSEKDKAVILYRLPESKAILKTKEISTNGHFTIMREVGGETALDLYDGTEVTAGPIKAEISAFTAMPVLALEEEKGKHCLRVKGDLTGYPAEASKQPHAGQFVKFAQEGQVSRWLPIERIEKKDGKDWLLFLSREPGFTFDANRKFLRDLFYPHRSLRGAATIILPSWLNLKWKMLPGGGGKLKVRSSGDVQLLISGLKNIAKAKVRGESKTCVEIPVKVVEGKVILDLSPRILGSGWWDIALGNDAIAECERGLFPLP